MHIHADPDPKHCLADIKGSAHQVKQKNTLNRPLRFVWFTGRNEPRSCSIVAALLVVSPVIKLMMLTLS